MRRTTSAAQVSDLNVILVDRDVISLFRGGQNGFFWVESQRQSVSVDDPEILGVVTLKPGGDMGEAGGAVVVKNRVDRIRQANHEKPGRDRTTNRFIRRRSDLGI